MFEFFLNMQIVNRTNNLNFKSIPIHSVNIKNADNTLSKAVFSKLNPLDYIDRHAVEQIKNTWDDEYLCATELFREDFFSKNANECMFHALELPGTDKLEKRILGLSESSFDCDKSLYLDLIFINPSQKRGSEQKKFKNLGEVLLASVFNIARKNDSSKLQFSSVNNGFYYKTFQDAKIKTVEMPLATGPHKQMFSDFIIGKTQIKKYIMYCQKKFNMQFPKWD